MWTWDSVNQHIIVARYMLSWYNKSIVHSKRTQELQQVEAGSVAGRTLVNNPLGNSTVSVHYNMMSGP